MFNDNEKLIKHGRLKAIYFRVIKVKSNGKNSMTFESLIQLTNEWVNVFLNYSYSAHFYIKINTEFIKYML